MIKKEKFCQMCEKISLIHNCTEKLHKIGFDINSNVMNDLYDVRYQLIALVQDLMNDKEKWIDWYFEGNRECTINYKPIKVRSFSDLYEIVTSRSTNKKNEVNDG